MLTSITRRCNLKQSRRAIGTARPTYTAVTAVSKTTGRKANNAVFKYRKKPDLKRPGMRGTPAQISRNSWDIEKIPKPDLKRHVIIQKNIKQKKTKVSTPYH